jgi:hypothetical protein
MLSFLLMCAAIACCTKAGRSSLSASAGTGGDCNARAAEICPAGYDTVDSTVP